MIISNLVPVTDTGKPPRTTIIRTAWEGKLDDGRGCRVMFEENHTWQVAHVMVEADVLPHNKRRLLFKSRVDGFLLPPYNLDDVRKALRHFATLA